MRNKYDQLLMYSLIERVNAYQEALPDEVRGLQEIKYDFERLHCSVITERSLFAGDNGIEHAIINMNISTQKGHRGKFEACAVLHTVSSEDRDNV